MEPLTALGRTALQVSRLGFGAIAAGIALGLGLWAGGAVYAPDSGQAGAAPGTGGGGMPYLVTSQRYLLPLFPALAAWQDLEL